MSLTTMGRASGWMVGAAAVLLALIAGHGRGVAQSAVDPSSGDSVSTAWSGAGAWAEGGHWSRGLPNASRTAWIRGASDVRVPRGTRAIAGGLNVGMATGDRARLLIDGGDVIVRRQYIRVGEAGPGDAAIDIADGALHGPSTVYVGGASQLAAPGTKARLHISGGSFMARLLWVGYSPGADAAIEIDGSRASSIYLMDYLRLFSPTPKAGIEGRTALAFAIDAHGVTPITIASRKAGNGGLQIDGDRVRLAIRLTDVPPRDVVTLVASTASTRGRFEGLPEGAAVTATHGGRTYTWTLTYRGGSSGHDLALKDPRGFASDAPSTRTRARIPAPQPRWLDVPVVDTPLQEGPVAFEGAEGFGAHTPGGRGGRTLYVENLNDDGPGSLRAALAVAEPRIVEFRVGGRITLASPLVVAHPFVSVLGQTAPSPGIELRGRGMVVQTHDVVLRHLRIRPGDGAGADADGEDALSFFNARRCIADHLSVSWSTDEALSITGLSDEITIQWSLIAEGLNSRDHGFASLAGGYRVTWHHNLFAHHVSRVPRFIQVVNADFRHNVIYDWGHTSGYGEFERLNYVGNYLKPGPSTRQDPPMLHRGDSLVTAGSLFVADNVMEASAKATEWARTVTADNRRGIGYDAEVFAAAPFAAPPVTAEPARAAYVRVLREAGATLPVRDAVDARVVRQVTDGTGRVIASTAEVDR